MKNGFWIAATLLPVAGVVFVLLASTGTIDLAGPPPDDGESPGAGSAGPSIEDPGSPPPPADDDDPPAAPEDPTGSLADLEKSWIEKAVRDWDPKVQNAALEEILAALGSKDPERVLAGLGALEGISESTFHRAPFRPLVVGHLRSASPLLRKKALYGLVSLGVRPEDLPKVLPLSKDPSPMVRATMVDILRRYTNLKLEGEVEPAILALLGDSDPAVIEKSIRGIGGAHVSLAIERRLVELAGDGPHRRSAIVQGLSRLHEKRPEVVSALLRRVGDEDPVVRKAVLEGLRLGTPLEQHPAIADAVTARLYDEKNPGVRGEMLRTLAVTGDRAHLTELERWVQDSSLEETDRKAGEIAMKGIRSRLTD